MQHSRGSATALAGVAPPAASPRGGSGALELEATGRDAAVDAGPAVSGAA